jgi:hypothetical protein
MRDIRRLYFYAVSVVSLEVVIWGVIGLLRSVVNNAIGGQISLLASSLALILVGVPVFLIHWWVAQRGALRDREERAARIRALFLYGVLGGMLVPAVQNGLTLINRFTLVVLGLQWKPIVGTGQTLGDNLIAIAVNLGMAVYFYSVLKSDWRAQLPGSSLVEMRRLYRFLWMVYGLGIGVVGLQQVLHSIFYIPQGIGGRTSYFFANGLALLIGGIPLWVAFWRILQKAADEPAEQQSMLRLVMLYLLSLAGVGTVLVEASQIITFLLRWALGSSQTFNSILLALGQPISVIIPLGGVWFYYGRQLSLNIEKLPEEPRRAGLHRLYLYILVAIGLGATILGSAQPSPNKLGA